MTTSVTSRRKVQIGCGYFGGSVRGPEHRRLRVPREDAWRGAGFRGGGGCIVVADGMGSCKEAARGARKAVGAAVRAFRNWSPRTGVEIDWMLRWLESQWRFDVAPSRAADCATTCLFAGWTESRGLVIGGLGDGMVLLRERDGKVRQILHRMEGAPLNETVALGRDHRLSDWVRTQVMPEPPWAAILMTDGVADDLRAERLDDFSRWLIEEVAVCPPSVRRRILLESLSKWPTPGHSDDKTIAVLLST